MGSGLGRDCIRLKRIDEQKKRKDGLVEWEVESSHEVIAFLSIPEAGKPWRRSQYPEDVPWAETIPEMADDLNIPKLVAYVVLARFF